MSLPARNVQAMLPAALPAPTNFHFLAPPAYNALPPAANANHQTSMHALNAYNHTQYTQINQECATNAINRAAANAHRQIRVHA